MASRLIKATLVDELDHRRALYAFFKRAKSRLSVYCQINWLPYLQRGSRMLVSIACFHLFRTAPS